jgi:hypothetical protein
VVAQIVIGVAVLALLIYRQLRTRPVNASGLRLAAILGSSAWSRPTSSSSSTTPAR